MARFNIQDSEYKKRSFSLAESCANLAILKKIQDLSYNPSNETITINGEDCTIVSITGTYIIHTQALIPKTGSHRATSNIEVTLNPDFSVANWKEVPKF